MFVPISGSCGSTDTLMNEWLIIQCEAIKPFITFYSIFIFEICKDDDSIRCVNGDLSILNTTF
ncbi:hypothetical protein OIU77_001185 [Salix suchowensis]|uniref:Uncharacterized protein n=1 Tax=Salix suchowensis TaxID=1278906 RepID=A0ABQ8ZGA7_9ROSI|nr:hypothetical protein OIU77_001185 [Salix suchowensis]